MTKINIDIEDLPLGALTVKQFKEVMGSIQQPLLKENSPTGDDDLLDLKSVMKTFSKSRSTIFSWKKKGVLPYVIIQGSIFFPRKGIVALINKQMKNKIK